VFILPFFTKINWSNPPIITILLILINAFVYFVIQGDDDKNSRLALEYYVTSELPEIEFPKYIDYLHEKGEHTLADQYSKVSYKSKEAMGYVIHAMIVDSQFMARLNSNEVIKPANVQFELWSQQRSEFNNKLDATVWYRYGLRPGKPELVPSFTHMFLHGSASHLIGNMLFLFIVGFVVEMVLGKTIYLFAYLLAGYCSSLLDILINSESIIPSVGASGAIAGLMGMYTILFGLRKIKFFYFVLVYFDYIKAPAIILFPLWLGNEFYQMFFGAPSNVNYLAHIGGLLGGGIIAFSVKQFTSWVDLDFMDTDAVEEAKINAHEIALMYLSKMQFDRAALEFKKLYEQHPDNRKYLIEFYKAAKHDPDSKEYHYSARKIMTLPGRDPNTLNLIVDTYREYIKLCENNGKFTYDMLFDLAIRFSKHGSLDEAAQLAKNLITKRSTDSRVAGVLLALSLAYKKSGQEKYSLYYAKKLKEMYPHSQEQRQL